MSLNAIKHFLSVCLWIFMFLLSFGYFGNVTAAESDPIWTWTPEPGYITSSPSISPDGTIYIGTYDYTTNAITAINPNGTKKWVFPTDSYVTASSVGHDGTIYITASGSKLYAINPNGVQKWFFSSPTGLTASAIGQNGTVYVGTGGLFYALNSNDGTTKWTSNTVCGGSPPAVARDGTIYVYGCNNNLHALDTNGNQKWTFFVNAWESTPPSIGADGTIYAGGWASLNAIKPDGTKKWIASVQGFAVGTAIATDGTLYMATDIHEGKLYAINPDGTQKWLFSSKMPNSFSHPAIGADGIIYVGGWDDKFYAINPDGTEKWTFGTGTWSSPALTANGTLIATSYSALYKFALTSGGLATSPWPMLSHDPQHTGQQSTGAPPSTLQTQMPILYQPNNFGWKFMSYANYTNTNRQTYYIYHPAADLNAIGDESGTVPVYAIADGEIVANTKTWGGIVIKHNINGQYYYSQYGHIKHLPDESKLQVGKTVSRGDQIGFVGNVGNVPYHLHFEIRDDFPLHPKPTLASYWDNTLTVQPDALSRKNVFKAYESPLAFIDTYSDPNGAVVIVDDGVTYSGIENDIIDNMIQIDVNRDGAKEIIKKRFFRAVNLQEWHPASNGGENVAYEGNYHYAMSRPNAVTSSGRWYFDIPFAGNYEVLASIPFGSKTKNANYAIYHNGWTDYVIIDQLAVSAEKNIAKRWLSLGTFSFQKGSNNFVELSNKTGEKNLKIGYDAIKLIEQ